MPRRNNRGRHQQRSKRRQRTDDPQTEWFRDRSKQRTQVPRMARSVQQVSRKLLKPGAVVWTWIPFAEADGRGKSRPVVIIELETNQAAAVVMPVGGVSHQSGWGCPELADWVAAGLTRPSIVLPNKYVVDVRAISSALGNLTARDWEMVRPWATRADKLKPVIVTDAPAV